MSLHKNGAALLKGKREFHYIDEKIKIQITKNSDIL